MPARRDVRRSSTRLLSAAMVVLGVIALVSSLARGGGPFAVGVIFGVALVAAGVARLYLERTQR